MKEYHANYEYKNAREKFSVTNLEGEVIIYPGSGPTDFICSIVEQLLLYETEKVKINIPDDMPDYYAQAIKLFEKFYNLIPDSKKPVGD